LESLIARSFRLALTEWDVGLANNFSDQALAHEFDVYFTLGAMAETGARRKDHLFRLFDHITDEAEKAKRITGYIRDAVRNRNSVASKVARREGRIGPISPEELSEGQAFVDPSLPPDAFHSEANFNSWAEGVAGKMAPGFFASLNRVQKAAVWSIANARSVDDSEAHRLAGRGRDALWRARKELPVTLRLQLNRMFATTEAPEVIDALVLVVAKAMLPLAQKWGSAGNPAG
jgi:hypothetical protein